jgi:hypothetical protein
LQNVKIEAGDQHLLPSEQHLASTWSGSELMQRTDEWIMQLTPVEIEELEAAADHILKIRSMKLPPKLVRVGCRQIFDFEMS